MSDGHGHGVTHTVIPTTMSSILDPSAITALLPTLLPPSAKKLTSSHDAIAAILHTAMSAVAFRLIAVDDVSPAQSEVTNVLPEEWNKLGPGNYTFRYRHDQSSLEFVVKVAKLGVRTVVNAIALEVGLHLHISPYTQPLYRAIKLHPLILQQMTSFHHLSTRTTCPHPTHHPLSTASSHPIVSPT
jgi:PI31 proteasome regulator N-terminal